MGYKRFIYSIVVVAVMTVSCKKEINNVEEVAVVAPLTQQDYMNVAYGADAAQKMDVYLPAGRTIANTKVIVFVHGGSWSGGDKSEFDPAIAALKTMLPDYAIFNINYRLANNRTNLYPTHINDVKAAVDFIVSKAGDYKVNANKVVMIGASAGAHLALLYAYKNNVDGRVKAVIDLFGPTDLVALYNDHPFPTASQPAIVNFLNATPVSNPTLYRDASPMNFVTAQSVPTQIFHGGVDFVVPLAQSTALKAKLEAVNVKVEMVVYPNEGHGWVGANLIDTYTKAVAFIQQNVK
jgi:acetyl esterase/lipase